MMGSGSSGESHYFIVCDLLLADEAVIGYSEAIKR